MQSTGWRPLAAENVPLTGDDVLGLPGSLLEAGAGAVAEEEGMPRKPMSDVIVLLPGITGSVLQKGGKDTWALTAKAGIRTLLSFGESI